MGSARVPRAGFGVAPKQSFFASQAQPAMELAGNVHDREDALASTRDACATQKPAPRLNRSEFAATLTLN
jgi:hypothetical protein